MPYNPFQTTYQPTYYSGYQFQQPQTQPALAQNTQPQSNLIWVQGESGAKSYLVAPNNTVQLWDSEAQKIYLKSADASGMPSIKTLEYTIKDQPVTALQNDNGQEFATKDDIINLQKEIEVLRAKYSVIPVSEQNKTGKTEEN